MGRQEQPLDPGQGPLARFACDLRELRRRAGSPPYRELAARTHYSASTLAAAAAGHRLPGPAVLEAFVRACGGDPDDWERCANRTYDRISRPPAV
ncbi:helix-turn-helix domain-containing protein, partial [Streptomyces sp. NPDC059411]|uniref:helix-turn-helix domain-containing protein n=1 Tax=Streptomyces sp. NPDC059411 TaxID=3346825 RepID=UPI003683F8B3